MKIKIIAMCMIAFLAFSGCENKEEEGLLAPTVQIPQKKEAEFVLDTIDNKKVTLKVSENVISINEDTYKNKVILLNFFATWCPPCRAEIPHLINLKTKYADQFEVIAVMLDDGLAMEEKKSFVENFKINYTVSVTQETNHALANLIGNVRSIPYMMLFSKDGKFVLDYKGAIPEEMIESDMKKLMEIK